MASTDTGRTQSQYARLEKLVHEFNYRPHPHALDYRQERDIRAETVSTALFFLLGWLTSLVGPQSRAVTKTRVADAVAGALAHALAQEHTRFAELGVALAPVQDDTAHDDDPAPDPPLIVHSLTATGMCASDCVACA